MTGSTTHLDQCGDDPLSRVKGPTALYQPAVADAAYQLRSAWTGWPSRGYSFALHSVLERIEQTKPHGEWERLRVGEYRGTDDCVQILWSTTPAITPIFVAHRAKRWLAYALRSAGRWRSNPSVTRRGATWRRIGTPGSLAVGHAASSPLGMACRAGDGTAGDRVLLSAQPRASATTGARLEHRVLRRYVRRVLDAGGEESCGAG